MVVVLRLVSVIAQLNGWYLFNCMISLTDLISGMEHNVKYQFVHVKTPEIALLQAFAHAFMVGQALIVRRVSLTDKI
jgi:hypothetical protein